MNQRLRLLALLLAVLPLAAQTPTADQIIKRAIHARGGEARLRAIDSQHLEMEITFLPETKGTIVVDIKRPGRMRQELMLNGKTYIQVLDGDRSWAQELPGPSPVRALSAGEIKNLSGPADLDGPLVGAKAKGSVVTYDDREAVGGRDAYKLKITGRDGTIRYDYIDAVTFLEIKWQGMVENDGQPVLTESRFGDFHKVNGVMLPFRIDSETPGTSQKQQIIIRKVELNQVPDSRFVRPAE